MAFHALDFPFPVLGLDEFHSHRKQPILTSPDLLNVRAYDPIEGRARGGQRLGTRKLYSTQLGGGDAIRMLDEVSFARGEGGHGGIDQDDFNRADASDLGEGWSVASWAFGSMRIVDKRVPARGLFMHSANVRQELDLDEDHTYRVQYDIHKNDKPNPVTGKVEWQKGDFDLYIRMHDSDPVWNENGIRIRVWVRYYSDGTRPHVVGESLEYDDGVMVQQTAFDFGTGVDFRLKARKKFRFAVEVTGNNMHVYIDDYLVIEKDVVAYSGKRLGIGANQWGVFPNFLDDWYVSGIAEIGEATAKRTVLCASAGGSFYATTEIGKFELIEAAGLSIDHTFMAQEQGHRLWITDYGLDPANYVYNPASESLDAWTALIDKGTVPTGCKLICLYRNRIVLAARQTELRNWYMSRVDNPLDWDYGAGDALSAVAGHNADAGRLGEEIRALIPFSDDYLVFGCVNSIWILRGDPAAGGAIDNVTYKTGILDKFAWCHDPLGAIYFLGQDGVYRMLPPGQPQKVSHGKLPAALAGIDTFVYEIQLTWDPVQRGPVIFLTRRGGGQSRHFFYNPLLDAFFPYEMPEDFGPMRSLDYGADFETYRRLLLGGSDGYIRCFEEGLADDCDEPIRSHVQYAPQRISGQDDTEGVLQSIQVAIGSRSDIVDYEIKVADTHEAAMDAPAAVSGRWYKTGLQEPIRERIRGGSVAIKLSNNWLHQTWAVEKLFARSKTAGRVRYGVDYDVFKPVPDIPIPDPPWPDPCTGCDICDACEICDVCEGADICADCDVCDVGDFCITCETCDTCDSEGCTTCDLCDTCEATCDTCDVCEACEACEICEDCDTCDTCLLCDTCELCDTCIVCEGCETCLTCETGEVTPSVSASVSVSVSPGPAVPCGYCGGDTPYSIQITVSGIIFQCTSLNGSFTLYHRGEGAECTWTTENWDALGSPRFQLFLTALGWTLEGIITTAAFLTWTGSNVDDDCEGESDLLYFSTFNCGDQLGSYATVNPSGL